VSVAGSRQSLAGAHASDTLAAEAELSPISDGMLARLMSRMNLRFPGLFVLFCALFLADFLIPDFIPFVDELGLALLTALFGMWKRRRVSSPAQR
jgi:hypothetical protein